MTVGLVIVLVLAAGVAATTSVAVVPAIERRLAAAGRALRHRSVERYRRWTSRLSPAGARAAWLSGWFVVLLGVTWLVGWLLTSVPADGGPAIDRTVTDWFADGRAAWSSALLEVVTDLGDTITLGVLGLAVAVTWRVRRGDWSGLEAILTGFGGAVLLYSAAKRLVGRARPDLELAVREIAGLAFPSGHTTGSAAFYVTVVLLVAVLGIGRRTRIAVMGACFTLVPMIALSRLYLGAHWVTDVLFGLLLGAAWAWVAATPLWARAGGAQPSSRRA